MIGTDNVDAQMGDGLPAELVLGLPGASIDEVCAPGGTVLYLGPTPRRSCRCSSCASSTLRNTTGCASSGGAHPHRAVAVRRPLGAVPPGDLATTLAALLSGSAPEDGSEVFELLAPPATTSR